MVALALNHPRKRKEREEVLRWKVTSRCKVSSDEDRVLPVWILCPKGHQRGG